MHIVMIIIFTWTFFVATDHVQPANTIGQAVIHSEAILQNNDDVTIITSEESIPIVIESILNPSLPNILRNDKEMPAT